MHLFLAPPGPDEPVPEIESLKALLQGERRAAETYARALSGMSGHPAEGELRRILQNHEYVAGVLCEVIRNLDADPDDAPRPSDRFRLGGEPYGTSALLAALHAGEEQGLRDCEAVLQFEDLPAEARFAVRAHVLPRCHEHIDALARLTKRPPPKG